MRTKRIRMFLCAAVAAAFSMFGTASHAVIHSLPFDPDNFLGYVNVDIPLSCLATFPANAESCSVSFLSADFTPV